jgi:putative transposase
MKRERKLNRLHGYDYSQNGAYFITICVRNRDCALGEIIENQMILNVYGRIVEKQWKWLFEQYLYLQADVFVIMPNHIHGILCIVGNGRDRSLPKDRSLRIKPIPQLIGAYKTTSSKLIHLSGNKDFQWQKSYWDRIIRDENELNKIREYIIDNPVRWAFDQDKPDDGFDDIFPCVESLM